MKEVDILEDRRSTNLPKKQARDRYLDRSLSTFFTKLFYTRLSHININIIFVILVAHFGVCFDCLLFFSYLFFKIAVNLHVKKFKKK